MRAVRIFSTFILLVAAALSTASCNVIGAIAQVAPQPDIAPAYKGLANQTVGVAVWVDRGVRVDYPTLQTDIARDLTTKMNRATHPKDPKDKIPPEIANIRYLDPMAIIRFQAEHPELEGASASDLATRLGVTRVIYLEVYSFETRPQQSIDLFKGTLLSKMQVMEVAPGANGAKIATVGYTDPDMQSAYPHHRPEGIAGSDVNTDLIYRKTVDQYTNDVALKFVTHPQE